MAKTILVNVMPAQTRVAVLEHGAIRDLYVEDSGGGSLVGNIYYAQVVRVLPGTQSAFVDFGGERTGFLSIADLAGIASAPPGAGEGRSRPAIGDLLHAGKKLVVQVTRDALGDKGARLSTDTSLSSRYLVFLPRSSRLAISQRISDPAERQRLRQLLEEALAIDGLVGQGGYILRSAAEGIAPAAIVADLHYLQRLWQSVSSGAGETTRPRLLYADVPLHLRVARDMLGPDVERVLVDCHESFQALSTFCEDFGSGISPRLEHYAAEIPLFDQYGVEQAVQQALGRRVELACGGYLVIEQTEAMTVVDVNTGSFVGRKTLEATLLQTNLEAADSLARQLRLRNLGGIIVVDFIDMGPAENRRRLESALESALRSDPVPTTVLGMTELGLVQITRKRTGRSLAQSHCDQCPRCEGSGVVKSVRTVCYDILREIMRVSTRSARGDELQVLASPLVVELMQCEESASLAGVAASGGVKIRLRAEPSFVREHFDIQLLQTP